MKNKENLLKNLRLCLSYLNICYFNNENFTLDQDLRNIMDLVIEIIKELEIENESY